MKREPFGADLQVGIAAAWPKARVGFSFVQRSHEFEGQGGADKYGQLADLVPVLSARVPAFRAGVTLRWRR